jgi:hypothetical protein
MLLLGVRMPEHLLPGEPRPLNHQGKISTGPRLGLHKTVVASFGLDLSVLDLERAQAI